MKNCPDCGIPLSPVEYEGFGVLRCEKCHGHLVDLSRLESIKRVALKSKGELKAEAADEFHGSNTGKVKCPRCHLPMRRQSARLPGLVMETDVCAQCSVVWLDGGELAIVQLGFESTPAFANAQEMKQRMAELEASPGRKVALEANMAKLPVGLNPIESALVEVAGDVLMSIVRSRNRNLFL